MARLPTRVDSYLEGSFDDIIDVRTAAEFAEDHIPGAINLPVLDEKQRAEVGTLYKQTSSFEAKKLGAALIARNIAAHIECYFNSKPQGYKPLFYCWRGGQRSESMALVLAQIGWNSGILTGGYKRYRRGVNQELELLPSQFEYRVVAGLTGVGKTHALTLLSKAGAQVLDLEDLAKHRGSLLGLAPGFEQPSQKYFETLLTSALRAFDKKKPVWVESESFKIGKLLLPKSLAAAMRASPVTEISLPVEARVDWLLQNYSHFMRDTDILADKLLALTPLHGKEKISLWRALIDKQDFRALISELLHNHYDRSYSRALSQNYSGAKTCFSFSNVEQISARIILENTASI